MSARGNEFERLAERILEDRTGQLTAPELDAVLTWLAGGERRGAGVLNACLGPADGQTELLLRVYEDLDDALFGPDGLEVEAAFVSAREEDGARRARYRRLMNAFHPDRFGDHADWLTSRSQAIHAAYQAYRRSDPAPSPATVAQPAAENKGYGPRKPRGSARLTPTAPGPLRRLRWHLRNVENLQAKVLGGLAALTLTPLLLVYLLDPAPAPKSTGAIQAAGSSQRPPSDTLLNSPEAEPASPSAPAPATVQAEQPPNPEPRNPEPVTRNPDPDPILAEALAANFDLSETRFEPPQGLREFRLPDQYTQPAPEPEPAQEPEPIPEPEPTPEPEPQPTQIRNPEPVTLNPEPVTLNPEPVTRNPEPVTRNPEPEPRTLNPEPVPEPPSPTIETRVATLLSAYESAFTQGDLDAFLAVLADNPRENGNRGRDWFRTRYRELFADSGSRRLEVSVADIAPLPGGWRVEARFELWVAYPDRRATHAERAVRYTLAEHADGQLRITAIDY